MVKNPPCNTGRVSSIVGQETKIPHATGELIPLLQLESPLPTTGEPVNTGSIPHAITKTQRSQINKHIFFKKKERERGLEVK